MNWYQAGILLAVFFAFMIAVILWARRNAPTKK